MTTAKLPASAITIWATHGGKHYRIGWLSLQSDSSISVGLVDSALILRDFEVKAFVWSAFNRVTTEFLAPDNTAATKRVYSPHMTFHPPHTLHLTEQKGGTTKRKPFEAIADIDLAVRQQGTVPWVRFTSKPVSKISPSAKDQKRQAIEVAVDLANSIRLSVDFVAPADTTADAALGAATWFDHGAYRVRVSVIEAPGQPASIGWIHQS